MQLSQLKDTNLIMSITYNVLIKSNVVTPLVSQSVTLQQRSG